MGRKTIVIVSLVLVLLGGCAGVATVPVQAPPIIIKCPAPPVINRPDLPVEHLTPTSQPDEVLKAAKLSIKMLQKWGLQMETILNGYRK